MYICIGGDLDGEIVNNREGTYFEASEIDPSKELPVDRDIFNDCIFAIDNLFLDESHKKTNNSKK
ncbi:hypothetical protein F4T72_18935 [Acinetobacter pittii]|nr:hypothetical protein [Acinetobacter pittii]MRA47784.1 hypothetical protein [Acinetobacter pittii]